MHGLLETQTEDPAATVVALAQLPPKARWPKWFAAALVLLVFAAIGYAFHRNVDLGAQALRDWVLLTGGFAALGALAAGAAELFEIVVDLVVERVVAAVGFLRHLDDDEAWIRRPRVGDFDSLRDDIVHWSGWWRNRVARTLLNFFLVSAGTIIGEYSAGIRIFRSVL